MDAVLFGLSDVSFDPTSVAEGKEGPLAAQAESITASTSATVRSTMENKTLITPDPVLGLMIVVLSLLLCRLESK